MGFEEWFKEFAQKKRTVGHKDVMGNPYDYDYCEKDCLDCEEYRMPEKSMKEAYKAASIEIFAWIDKNSRIGQEASFDGDLSEVKSMSVDYEDYQEFKKRYM